MGGATPFSRVVDCCATDPTYTAGGSRVLVQVEGNLEVRDASQEPELPGVPISPPGDGLDPFSSFNSAADGSTVLATAIAETSAVGGVGVGSSAA